MIVHVAHSLASGDTNSTNISKLENISNLIRVPGVLIVSNNNETFYTVENPIYSVTDGDGKSMNYNDTTSSDEITIWFPTKISKCK